MYRLLPTEDKNLLFFRLDGEAAERHGVVGYLRADFGTDGYGFHFNWFDSQKHLKTNTFRSEIASIVNSLRTDGHELPFASRKSLEAFCTANPGKDLTPRGNGYMIRTEDHSYYFRCLSRPDNYDIYCIAYDNRYLLPELAGKHRLPADCYSILPSSGELILIVSGKYGYYPSYNSTPFEDVNRRIADESNKQSGITRAQEEAMLAGSLFGWDTPAARPWKYDADGKPFKQEPKKTGQER